MNAPVYIVPKSRYSAWLVEKIMHVEPQQVFPRVADTVLNGQFLMARTGTDGYFFHQHILSGSYYVFTFYEEDIGAMGANLNLTLEKRPTTKADKLPAMDGKE